MSWVFSLLSYVLRGYIYRFTMKSLRKKGLLIYLKFLQILRKSLLLAAVIFFALQMMLFGFMGALVSGIWLLPFESTEAKLTVLFVLFSLMFLVPFSCLFFLFSERLWYKVSGAEQLINPSKNLS